MSHLHQKVSALVDGELTGKARARALKHVRKCAACRQELDETLALKARLSGLPAFDPSPDLFVSLGSVAGDGSDPESSPSRQRHTVRRLLIGAGSVSVVVLSIAYAVGGPEESTRPAVAPPVDALRAEFGGTTGDDLLSDAVVPGIRTNDPHASPVAARSGSAPEEALKLQAAAALPVIAAGDDRRALAALKRVVRATKSFAFTGTRKVEAFDRGDPVEQTIDVAHVPGQGTTIEVDGTDESAFLPDDDAAASRLEALADSYDLAVLDPDQVLGRPATVLGVGSDGELVAKVWIDDESGLMLKRELYHNGRLVRASEYVTIHISRGDAMFLNHLGPELATSSDPLDTSNAARFSDAGWACPQSLGSGFQLTGLMRMDNGGDVMHAEYTDGLSSVSVFSERGTLDPSKLGGFRVVDEAAAEPVYLRAGLPTVAVWESDSTVYAVVSDAPVATVSDIVAALPHRPDPRPGIGDRVGTGLDRMAGFLTPLS